MRKFSPLVAAALSAAAVFAPVDVVTRLGSVGMMTPAWALFGAYPFVLGFLSGCLVDIGSAPTIKDCGLSGLWAVPITGALICTLLLPPLPFVVAAVSVWLAVVTLVVLVGSFCSCEMRCLLHARVGSARTSIPR